MPQLFSPIKIARSRLPNRIVLAPGASGYATADGFITEPLANYYLQRAQGGVGLLIIEPALVLPPESEMRRAHVGLYHDAFVPLLAGLTRRIHMIGARVIVALEAPDKSAADSPEQLAQIRESFICAGWRALLAGCDGLMLSSADGGLLHTLISPLRNNRHDCYGNNLDGRLQLAIEIIEGLHEWLGRRMLIGFRLNADELTAGGITLQDARVIAKRVVSAGVGLLDVTLTEVPDVPVASFPGWRVPLAAGIKRVMLDVPIMTSGGLGDPLLADGVVRDGSVDLVMLDSVLRADPAWPRYAYTVLHPSPNGNGSAKADPPLYELIADDIHYGE